MVVYLIVKFLEKHVIYKLRTNCKYYLYQGDVLVWNLRDNVSVAPTTICTHGDCVSQVYWKARTINDMSLLVSSSKDGYIFIHKMMANFTVAREYKR